MAAELFQSEVTSVIDASDPCTVRHIVWPRWRRVDPSTLKGWNGRAGVRRGPGSSPLRDLFAFRWTNHQQLFCT
jgi:hypothetical protein